LAVQVFAASLFATYSGTLYFGGVDPATALQIYKFEKDAVFNIQRGTGRYFMAVFGVQLANALITVELL
jgi:hypothetical protein